MAKADFSKFNKDMKKILEEFKKPVYMQQIGEYAGQRIVKRTKLGRGVDRAGGESQPLTPLANSTKEGRKRLRDRGDLSSDTTPNKSNLTATGQMLDSVSVRASIGKAFIYFKGKRSDGNKTNADIAGYVSEKRPFFNLSKAEQNGLNRFIRELMEKIVRKVLT